MHWPIQVPGTSTLRADGYRLWHQGTYFRSLAKMAWGVVSFVTPKWQLSWRGKFISVSLGLTFYMAPKYSLCRSKFCESQKWKSYTGCMELGGRTASGILVSRAVSISVTLRINCNDFACAGTATFYDIQRLMWETNILTCRLRMAVKWGRLKNAGLTS